MKTRDMHAHENVEHGTPHLFLMTISSQQSDQQCTISKTFMLHSRAIHRRNLLIKEITHHASRSFYSLLY